MAKVEYALEYNVGTGWIRSDKTTDVLNLEDAEKFLHDKGFKARIVKITTSEEYI